MKAKLPKHDWPAPSQSVRARPTRTIDRKGLDNSDLRLLNISDAEIVFHKYRKAIWIIQKSPTLPIAAKKLKLSLKQTTTLANTIRRGGVPLKTFNKHWLRLSPQQIESLRGLAKKLKTPDPDYEKFVQIWQTKGTRAVMKAFGLTRNKASWIANWLRVRCKIPLKNYRIRLDRPTLQRIADETLTSSSPIPPHRKSPSSQ